MDIYSTYPLLAAAAFAAGVLDYLVKPVEAERLAETVARKMQNKP